MTVGAFRVSRALFAMFMVLVPALTCLIIGVSSIACAAGAEVTQSCNGNGSVPHHAACRPRLAEPPAPAGAVRAGGSAFCVRLSRGTCPPRAF